MLEIRDLHAYYGKSHILQGVDLTVAEGEIVSLLGRNGVGRSTTCKAIMGLVHPHGSISFKGRPIAGLRPEQIAHTGIGYVPEDRQVFPTLTVQQNLELGMKRAGKFGRWNFEDVYKLFPNLDARRHNPAGYLSGGEQQMLTMCRTLMGDPDLVIIDADVTREIEKTDRITHVMQNGRVFEAGTMNEVGASPKARKPFFFEGLRGQQAPVGGMTLVDDDHGECHGHH